MISYVINPNTGYAHIWIVQHSSHMLCHTYIVASQHGETWHLYDSYRITSFQSSIFDHKFSYQIYESTKCVRLQAVTKNVHCFSYCISSSFYVLGPCDSDAAQCICRSIQVSSHTNGIEKMKPKAQENCDYQLTSCLLHHCSPTFHLLIHKAAHTYV